MMSASQYPARSGVALRNWLAIEQMKRFATVAVWAVGAGSRPALPSNLEPFHYVETNSRTGLMGYARESVKLSGDALPRTVHQYTSNSGIRSLSRLLHSFRPELVILEEPFIAGYLPIVQRFCSQIIFDCHNVQAALDEQLLAGSKSFRRRFFAVREIARMHRVERILVQAATQIWATSEWDKELICRRYLPRSEVLVVPNTMPAARFFDFPAPTRGQLTHPVVTFVGVLEYEPNEEAAIALLEQVFPIVKIHFPSAKLRIIGKGASLRVRRLAAATLDVELTGEVEQMAPYLEQSTLMVIPLRRGGGTRLKILEAFAARRPVVTTSKGAEGLECKHGEHLLICDDLQSMGPVIVDLLHHPESIEGLARRAHTLVEERYSPFALRACLRHALDQLSTRLPKTPAFLPHSSSSFPQTLC